MEKQDLNRTATRVATLSTRLTDLVRNVATEPTEEQIKEALRTTEKILHLCAKLHRIEEFRRADLNKAADLAKLRE